MPQKTVVMTFDDAVSNHATFCAPLLKKFGFNATFFVCEFPPDFETNKTQYMTWEQIKGLHDAGFEIGNHTLRHKSVTSVPIPELDKEIMELEERCRQYGISRPVTFAYPGGPKGDTPMESVFDLLERKGFQRARSGEARCHVPGQDDPLLIPSFPVHGEDKKRFYDAAAQATEGRIPIFMFHGVPEYTHPWVDTRPEVFEEYVDYLAKNNYRVIAMRDLP
jgi:peptidoglycan-N-acetylglucosamine deacetylase